MIKRLKTPAALAPGMLLALLSCARLDSHAGPGVYFHRGVNFTAERSVRYDAPEARTMLERLPEWGVNTVALVPYGFARRNPVRVVVSPRRSWQNDEGMERLAPRA